VRAALQRASREVALSFPERLDRCMVMEVLSPGGGEAREEVQAPSLRACVVVAGAHSPAPAVVLPRV